MNSGRGRVFAGAMNQPAVAPRTAATRPAARRKGQRRRRMCQAASRLGGVESPGGGASAAAGAAAGTGVGTWPLTGGSSRLLSVFIGYGSVGDIGITSHGGRPPQARAGPVECVDWGGRRRPAELPAPPAAAGLQGSVWRTALDDGRSRINSSRPRATTPVASSTSRRNRETAHRRCACQT